MVNAMTSNNSLLLVDDEENITRSIKRLCRPLGYEIRTASSAAQAIAMMEEDPAQVVLSDQLMPEMTGSEMFSRLRISHPNSVRVLLTGYTSLEGLTSAVNKGRVFKILFKPWEDEHLITTLLEAFEYFNIIELNRKLTHELHELNAHLEERVEQKARELNLHIRHLQVSQSLFELFPEAAIGISNDGIIIQANRKARELFDPQPLVGMSAENVFPQALQSLINSPKDDCFTVPLQIGLNTVTFEVIKSSFNNEWSGSLLFGHMQKGF